MNRVPRLSIGLPVYNGEDYLTESLDALLGQTYEDFELIISDNASTDGTADICQRYAKQDSRVRYVRQPRNIGLARNHDFVFQQSCGELFKWAAADDLYGQHLLERCVDALDEYPDVVLAHTWEAAIDASGTVIQSFEYPLATDSANAPERFRSILFGSSGLFESKDPDVRGFVRVDNQGILRACDEYGVIRTDVMRRIAPHASYHHSDRVLVCELALHRSIPHNPGMALFPARLPRSDLQQDSVGARPLRPLGPQPGQPASPSERPSCGGVSLGLRGIDPACAPLVSGTAPVLPEPRSVDPGPSDFQIPARAPSNPSRHRRQVDPPSRPLPSRRWRDREAVCRDMAT